MNKDITVVFSTHNNLPYLKLAYQSAIEYATRVKEVIIYAENCTDGTNEWLQNDIYVCQPDGYDEPIKVNYKIVKDNSNAGIGTGTNEAIKLVNTDYFILLHSDMVVAKGYDEILYKYYKAKTIVSAWRCEPDIWGNQMQTPGLLTLPKEAFGEYHHNFKYKEYNAFASQFSDLNKHTIKNMAGAGGYLMSKKDWDELGGNDSLFNPACYEDIDLCLRAQYKGFDFICTTETIIYHFGARGSWYMDDQIGNKSERQIKAEQEGIQKWLNKWGEGFKKDGNGLPILTETMQQYILKNQTNYLY